MKLTDANKIRDYVKEQINPYGKPFEGSVYEFGLKIMRYIDNMSTAYDIEKVVEELKSEAERWEYSGKEYNERHEIAVARGLRNAITIVKKGCVGKDVE